MTGISFTAVAISSVRAVCRVDIHVRIGVIRRLRYVLESHMLTHHRFEHDQVNCMMQCSIKLDCGHRCMGTFFVDIETSSVLTSR
jgi:hypothetical protein